ncbi:hypothetical protein ACFX12_040219 [Malus domestica]
MSVEEMRMLHWMCGHTRNDRIRNEDIRGKVGVAEIEGKMRENRLRCTVCLAEYHGDDVLRILPYCEHSFHVTCIDIWLQQHSTCPVCRISLREFPEIKRRMQPLSCSAIRSHYGTESFNTLSYRYLLNSRASRTHENHGMDPIQEDHAASEGDATDAGENSSSLTESNQISNQISKD